MIRFDAAQDARRRKASSTNPTDDSLLVTGSTWESLTKLKDIALPLFIKNHLREYGTDAAAFLNEVTDNFTLEQSQSVSDRYVKSTPKDEMLLDNLRLCFMMLGGFDQGQLAKSGRIDLKDDVQEYIALSSLAPEQFASLGVGPET